MGISSHLLLFGPPLIALTLGFYTQIRSIRYILIGGSAVFITIFGIWELLRLDCNEEKFFFYNCSNISEPIANLFSKLYLISLFAYVFVAPLLLLIMALLEWLVRLGRAREL